MSTTPSTVAPPSAAHTAAPARRIPWMLLAVLTVIVALALAASYWFFVGRFVETTDDAYVGGDVTVMAPKVNGFVTDVLVHEGLAPELVGIMHDEMIAAGRPRPAKIMHDIPGYHTAPVDAARASAVRNAGPIMSCRATASGPIWPLALT